MLAAITNYKNTYGLAINNFRAKLVSQEITLPDNLEIVTDDTPIIFPNAITFGNKIVPISYDADTNTISLAGPN